MVKANKDILQLLQSVSGQGSFDDMTLKQKHLLSRALEDWLTEQFNRKIDTLPIRTEQGVRPGSRIRIFQSFEYPEHSDPGGFHYNSHPDIPDNHPMLVVSIALMDSDAMPIALSMSPPLSGTQRNASYHPCDPSDSYVIVPKMEKGNMLVFFGNSNKHGSVIVDGNDGERERVCIIRIYLRS